MMTNGDMIRHATDEELAEMKVIGRTFCTIPNCEEVHGDCRKCSLKWLREEVDNGKQQQS